MATVLRYSKKQRERQRYLEMRDLLKRFGFDPNDAVALYEEGMGPEVLELRLKQASLTHTHGFRKMRANPSAEHAEYLKWDENALIASNAANEEAHTMLTKAPWYQHSATRLRKLAKLFEKAADAHAVAATMTQPYKKWHEDKAYYYLNERDRWLMAAAERFKT